MTQQNRRPWLFMDLDGVVSPVPPQSAKARIARNGPPTGYRTWPGALYDMYVDERLLDWAEQLDRVYDVVWASSWDSTLLPVVAAPLGLDHWPVLPIPLTADASFGSGPLSHKTKAIAGHLANDPRPFAWCDDYLDRRSLPVQLRSPRLPHLLISPSTRKGLTPEHVEELLEIRTPAYTRLTGHSADARRVNERSACTRAAGGWPQEASRGHVQRICPELTRGQPAVHVSLHPRAPPPVVNQHSHPVASALACSLRHRRERSTGPTGTRFALVAERSRRRPAN